MRFRAGGDQVTVLLRVDPTRREELVGTALAVRAEATDGDGWLRGGCTTPWATEPDELWELRQAIEELDSLDETCQALVRQIPLSAARKGGCAKPFIAVDAALQRWRETSLAEAAPSFSSSPCAGAAAVFWRS